MRKNYFIKKLRLNGLKRGIRIVLSSIKYLEVECIGTES